MTGVVDVFDEQKSESGARAARRGGRRPRVDRRGRVIACCLCWCPGLLTGLLLSGASAIAQVQYVPLEDPDFPLAQVGYLKASNSEAYDHFACGGASPGHTGNSIAISRDGLTMVIGAPHESGGATGIDGDPNDNSAFGAGPEDPFCRRWRAQRTYSVRQIRESTGGWCHLDA